MQLNLMKCRVHLKLFFISFIVISSTSGMRPRFSSSLSSLPILIGGTDPGGRSYWLKPSSVTSTVKSCMRITVCLLTLV